MLGGLSCPRPPVKRVGDRAFETCPDKEERPNVTGPERTEEFMRGAELTLSLCRRYGVTHAILCTRSPSCGENGFTTRLLKEEGIQVTFVF